MPIDPDIRARSRATDAFLADVARFLEHAEAPRVVLRHRAPRVKVLRLLHQLLDAEPELAVERVAIDARSGCSDFTGTITVQAEVRAG